MQIYVTKTTKLQFIIKIHGSFTLNYIQITIKELSSLCDKETNAAPVNTNLMNILKPPTNNLVLLNTNMCRANILTPQQTIL